MPENTYVFPIAEVLEPGNEVHLYHIMLAAALEKLGRSVMVDSDNLARFRDTKIVVQSVTGFERLAIVACVDDPASVAAA